MGVDVFNAKPSGSGWVPITSAYDSTTGRISLATIGDFKDSDAVDGDVILHEYAHALQHTLRGGVPEWSASPETTASEQAAALMEGHADFVAASRFDDPQWAEHKAVAKRARKGACAPRTLRQGPGSFGAQTARIP